MPPGLAYDHKKALTAAKVARRAIKPRPDRFPEGRDSDIHLVAFAPCRVAVMGEAWTGPTWP